MARDDHRERIPLIRNGRLFLPISREFPETSRHHDHAERVLAIVAFSALAIGAVTLISNRERDGVRRRAADDAPARISRHGSGSRPVVGKTILIARPRADLYAFWKDFHNLPAFMENIRSVEVEGRRSKWTLAAPAGRTVTAEVELVDDQPGERLAWKSLPSSQIETEGSVNFRDAPAGRGTYVEAVIAYRPPAGTIGRTIANLFRREPHVQARHELKRFKMLMEAGEVATSSRSRSQS